VPAFWPEALAARKRITREKYSGMASVPHLPVTPEKKTARIGGLSALAQRRLLSGNLLGFSFATVGPVI
jgi:hypothetical protein